jgi:hypothetical protein
MDTNLQKMLDLEFKLLHIGHASMDKENNSVISPLNMIVSFDN